MDTNNLRQVYRKDAPYLINFDWEDVVRGQGYIEFFAGAVIPQAEEELTAYDENDDEAFSYITGSIQKCIAQTITLSEKSWITNIEVYGTDDISSWKISLEETTTGEPNGKTLATGSINFVAGAANWQKWTLSNPLELAAGTYAICLNHISGQVGSAGDIFFRADGTSPTYAGGTVWTSGDAGGTWTQDTTTDIMFRVNGFTTNPYILFPIAFETEYGTMTFPASELITSETQIGEINFDIDVERSLIVSGKAILEFKWTSVATLNNTGDYDSYFKVYLYKVNSSDTETQIGTSTNITSEYSGAANNTYTIRTTFIINCSETVVSKGDKLRLSFEAYSDDCNEGDAQNNELSYSTLVYDPEDETNNNDIKLKLPIKVQN